MTKEARNPKLEGFAEPLPHLLLDCLTGPGAHRNNGELALTPAEAADANVEAARMASRYRWLPARRFLAYGDPDKAQTFDDRPAADSYADFLERTGVPTMMVVDLQPPAAPVGTESSAVGGPPWV